MKPIILVVVIALTALSISSFVFPSPDSPGVVPGLGRAIATAQPSGIGEFADPVRVGVSVTTRDLQAYMYHYDALGKLIFEPSSIIPAGTLIKSSACLWDGYAQVEYQAEDNYWKVEYVKCQ